MKLLRKIKTYFNVADDKRLPDANESNSTGRLRQREQELYGMDRLAEQRLYERWVSKDTWHLKTEALPLFFGLDPDVREPAEHHREVEADIELLWDHAVQCVEQGLLQVTNRENDPGEWHVSPLNAYQWAAVSRVEMPASLSELMDFVANSVKRTTTTQTTHQDDRAVDQSGRFDGDREKILGMALAILAAYPEESRNNKGRVNVNRVMRIMGEKKAFWIGDESLSLSDASIRDLLDKWLATLP